MSWNYDTSLERIQNHLDNMGEIEIEKLSKEADLNSLLTETCCREIHGAHVYFSVSNFSRLASEDASDEDEYKRLIQALHIYEREVSHIVEDEDKFDAFRVHFQGAKLHALLYRPIDKTKELAIAAFFLLLVLKDFVARVFNPAFPSYDNFSIAGGVDVGDSIGTRNGKRNDRELLFLGPCANYAAKAIGTTGQLQLTKELYDVLPSDLREHCEKVEDGVYQIKTLNKETLDDLLTTYDFKWDRESSRKRIDQDKADNPLKDISYSNANELIDLDALSIRNNKRVLGASVFGDIAGFTRYIDKAETDDEKRAALRVLHVTRREMAKVLTDDYKGLRVQFQGDRVQGFFHIPKDEESEILIEAVEAAIGLQSSMELTIKKKVPDAVDLHLAIGVDIDKTLVSKLGTRAHRDRICIGKAVESAAALEEACAGSQIGISRRVYDALPEYLGKHFEYDEDVECYVANNLTTDKVERAAKSAAAVAGAPAFITSDHSGVRVSQVESESARRIIPTRSYAEE